MGTWKSDAVKAAADWPGSSLVLTAGRAVAGRVGDGEGEVEPMERAV